jgi:hypothetical protein
MRRGYIQLGQRRLQQHAGGARCYQRYPQRVRQDNYFGWGSIPGGRITILVGGQYLEAGELFWLGVNTWRQENYFGWGSIPGGRRSILVGGQYLEAGELFWLGGQWLEAGGLFWLEVNSWRQEEYLGWRPMAGAGGVIWVVVNSWRQEEYFGRGPMAGSGRTILVGGQ